MTFVPPAGPAARSRFLTIWPVSLVAVLALVLCPSSRGATVTSTLNGSEEHYNLVYSAAPGETNDVTYAEVSGDTYVIDQGAVLHAGTGCESRTRHVAICIPGEDFIFLGNGADSIHLGNTGDQGLASFDPVTARIFGGRGADLIDASLDLSNGFSVLDGEEGADRIHGSLSNDFAVVGGPGPDVLNPGSGEDSVEGDGGNDRINTVDGARDEVSCGDGRDRAVGDGDHYAKPDDEHFDCESITVLPAGGSLVSVPDDQPFCGSKTHPLAGQLSASCELTFEQLGSGVV